MANDQLQFLVCSECNGFGSVNGKRCPACHGYALVGYLNGQVLYWSRKITPAYILLYKLEALAYKISGLILLILGGFGLLSLFYSMYLVNFSGLLQWSFWTDTGNIYHLIFWASCLIDLFIIYYLSIIKDKKETVIAKQYKTEEEMEVLPPPPVSWREVKEFKGRDKIDITKSFTDEAIKVVERAFKVAGDYKSAEVAPVHFLIASLLVSNRAINIFSRLDIDLNDLGQKLGRIAAKYSQPDHQPSFSVNSYKILFKAYRLAFLNKLNQVEVTEIIQAAIKNDENIQELFLDLDISNEKVENVIFWYRIRALLRQQWFTYRAGSRFKSKTGIDRAMTAIQTPYLNKFSEDLTMLAKMGYLDLCINREREFEGIFRVLEGSSSKGVILVGETGVGKTAIIEGLAQKMIADDVPEFLRDKRLVSISSSRLVSGASASEAQERLLICLNEALRAGNVTLYIDNIHDLIGISSGGPESLDLSDVLVEALSKGALTLITSTTPSHYTRFVEKTSLGNLVKKVEVPEPDFNQAIQIIEGKIGFIENKNNVYFSYNALEQAVKLTSRFVHEQFLPYKAIVILEEVAVWVRKNKGAKAMVAGNDVADLLSEKIGIPVAELSEPEKEKLLNIEELIHERIIDQVEAVKAVASSLKRARAELRAIDRPIATLLFLGPTGVGKTELAKAIAAIYFGNENNMVRLDMSEYQEKDSINRMIGSPPGYGQAAFGGQLTDAVRQNPFTIVLLDELEKAHPDILNLFLQVMEDGRLTDAEGRTVDFTNVILIATSNAQTSFIQEKAAAGLSAEEIKKLLLETELKQHFKPEFINRFDNVIVFKPLGFEEIVSIAKLMLNEVAKNLEAKGINFQASQAAIEELAKVGFDPQYGARPMRRVIQEQVNNALADFLLQGKISRRDVAILEQGGVIRVEKAEKL